MKKTVFVFAILLLAAPLALADKIYLRSGKTIEGRIVSEDSENVQIERKIGSSVTIATYPRSEIERVEKSKPEDDPGAAPKGDEPKKGAEKKAPEKPGGGDDKGQDKYGKELEGVGWGDAFVIPTKHYVVKCNSTKEVAQRYADFLEKIYAAYDKIFAKYKHYWNKPSTVYIFRNNGEFQEYTHAGEGVGGFYRPKSPDENAFPDRIVAAFHGKFGTTGDTRLVLAHEGTHQMEHILCMGSEEQFLMRPPWWAEGFAVYFGDGFAFDKKGNLEIGIPRDRLSSLQQAIKAGQVPDKLKISEFVKWDYRPYQQMAGLAYPYGWGLVYYFLHRGEDKKGQQKAVKINGKDVQLAKVLEDFFKAVTDMPPSSAGEDGLPEYYAKKLDSLLGFPVDNLADDWKKFILALELPKLGKVKGQIFESQEGAFTIEKPKDWKFNEEDLAGEEAIRIENEKSTGLVKVMVEGNMENKGIDEIADGVEQEIYQMLASPDFEKRGEPIEVAGTTGKEFVLKGTIPELPEGAPRPKHYRSGDQVVRIVLIVNLKRSYQIICVTNAEKAEENSPVFESILKGFKILKEKEG
jgi:hypothetical protein